MNHEGEVREGGVAGVQELQKTATVSGELGKWLDLRSSVLGMDNA